MIYSPALRLWVPPRVGEPEIPLSPPKASKKARERALLKSARSFTGRLPATLKDCVSYLRGLGDMSGLVGESGHMEAAFGPMAPATTQLALDVVFGYRLESDGTDVLSANNLTLISNPSFSAAKVGNGMAPTGTQYGYHADATAFNMSATSFTVSGWAYQHTQTGTQHLFGKSEQISSTEYYDWRVQAYGSPVLFQFGLTFNDNSNGGVGATTFGTVPADTWCWVLMYWNETGDSSGIQINNGTADTQSNTGKTMGNDAYSQSIGFSIGGIKRNGSDMRQGWIGTIDEVYGWKRLLTSPEKASLYNSGNGAAWGSW